MNTTIELRIAKLERSLQFYRSFFLLSVCLISFLVISSFKDKQAVQDRVQAKSFEVVDDYGNVLAKLSAYKDAGSLVTYTNGGKTLIYILKNVDGNGAVVGYNRSEN